MKLQQIRQIINNYIAREQDAINEHNQIANILKTVEGKDITARTLNQKLLGDNLHFKIQHGMYYIVGKYQHLIGYQNSKESVIAVNKTDYSRGFEYFDTCHGSAAQERIDQLNNIDMSEIRNIFSQIEKHFNSLRELFGDIERKNLGSFDNPVYYDLLRAIYQPDDDSRNTIKLSDFYFIRK